MLLIKETDTFSLFFCCKKKNRIQTVLPDVTHRIIMQRLLLFHEENHLIYIRQVR